MSKRAIIGAALAMTLVTSAAPTVSSAREVPTEGSATDTIPPSTAPPHGLIDFCLRTPEECRHAGQAGEALRSELTAARRASWAHLFAAAGRRPLLPAALRAGEGRGAGAAGARAGNLGVAPPVRIARTGAPWVRVGEINDLVNRTVRPTLDQRQYGRADYWALPGVERASTGGDCEDFVLAKRRALLAYGLPPATLSIALARTRAGEPHAVLLVATDDGEYVLDNQDGRILHWAESELTWESRQLPGALLSWITLSAP